MSVEISLYIQTERKQKFVGRFEFVLNSAVVSSKDITRKVLEYVSRSVPSIRNPEEARVSISLPESQGGVKLTSTDKIGTSCGSTHLIATYKNFGEPDVESERKHTIEEMLATGNTKFYSLVVRDPYNPNADPQCFNVSAQMPVNKVLNKVRELYYRPDFVGEQPTQCGMMVSFGAPSREVAMEETITVTKDEMEEMMNKIRDDIIAGRVNFESSDDEPLVTPLSPQNEVIAPPQVPFNAFSGTGLKLGEPEPATEPKISETDKPKAKVDEGVASSSDRWESDDKPIPLNEKNEVNCNEFYLKLHGKTVYTYYAKKGENFTCLFSLLQSVGINVGSPADTSSEYSLEYASSKAYKHEFLDDWGGKGSTYFLVPRQLGGGPHQKMKKTHKLAILKSKCSNASAKASCDALAGDLLMQASQVYQEMMNDESGDYINRCLRKMSIAQLEELLGKMNTMVLTEKSFVKLVEYIIPIYKDIAMTATKVDTASKALEEAFQYQMAFSFYNDAKGKFTFTLPDIVATILATKKDGNDMAL